LQNAKMRCIFTSTNKQTITTMKTLIETTTAAIASQMILDHCGNYAGEFQDEAYGLLNQVTDLPEFENEEWADIMYDREGNVYAIYADGELTSNSKAIYIELDREDCERAFEGMELKLGID